eukprot:3400605-Lingulodinium_polyedra.AAC.1
MEQFKTTSKHVYEISAADPHPHHPNCDIYCGAAELSIRNVGKAVFVADISNIQTFTYDEIRGILDVCACFVD